MPTSLNLRRLADLRNAVTATLPRTGWHSGAAGLVLMLAVVALPASAQSKPAAAKQKTAKPAAATKKPAPAAKPRRAAPAAVPVAAAPVVPVAPTLEVLTGAHTCEFDQRVELLNAAQPGQFRLRYGDRLISLVAEPALSGAVRLVDVTGGLLWLQVTNKSMLLDTRKQTRLVDNCLHPGHREDPALALW